MLRDCEILERSHPEPLIHVTESPWEWHGVDMISMCDATNIVIDAEHGRHYEAMQSRRAVSMTLEQARDYIRFVAETRIWNYHWEPLSKDPGRDLRPAQGRWRRCRGFGCLMVSRFNGLLTGRDSVHL